MSQLANQYQRVFKMPMLSGVVLICLSTLLVQMVSASEPEIMKVVLRRPGDDGSKAYRIPGLATSNSGTLLAVFDIRHDGAGDLPANIDVGLMRSTDQGQSWSAMQTILDFDRQVPESRGNGVGDPAILVDTQTGTIWVAALWSQGDRAWKGSGPGLSPAETGQLVLTKSSDDGLTWSPPINISSQVIGRDARWRLLFNGPGRGIQLRDGTLVFAAQFRQADGTPHSCFLYSRDHGSSWKLSPPAFPNQPPTSESQIAELPDGSLLLTLRDESRSGQRAWARWQWHADPEPAAANLPSPGHAEGQWVKQWHVLPDPTCMASLWQVPDGPLLFANPNHAQKRIALTIRASRDGGQSWNAGLLLDPRPSMYSCMTLLSNGQLGILYEVDDTLTFARMPLEAITEAQ